MKNDKEITRPRKARIDKPRAPHPFQRAMDEHWMHRALALARRGEGMTRPNPPVGAVVVKGEQVLGQGFHRRAGGPHAEVFALREAGPAARGGTLYVTLEPCCTWGRTPPCTDLIVSSGVARVVVAAVDPNPKHSGRGLTLLRRHGIAVESGVCREAGERVLEPFAKWIRTGRPYVTLKLAVSLDGRIADYRGRSRWITGARARAEVQHMRRQADAVLVGSRTAILDNPSLLPKPARGRLPFRIVIDSEGRLPLTARMLNDGKSERTILATTKRCPRSRQEGYRRKGAQVWSLPVRKGRASVEHLLRKCGKAGFLRIVCEGGGELAQALILARQVDELVFFVAPCIIGGSRAPASVAGNGWRLTDCPKLEFLETRRIGKDLLVRARPIAPRQR